MAARKQTGETEARASRSVQMALIAGVVVVFAATAVNIVLAGMTQAELNDLPYYLALPYDWCGRLGVTLALICVGAAVILIGLIGERLAIWTGYLIYGPSQVNVPLGHGSSVMELETAKYLRGYHHSAVPDPMYHTAPRLDVQSESPFSDEQVDLELDRST